MSLAERIAEAAAQPVLLLACDYDGTMAPIVEDPERARADREVLVALKQLAALSDTHVAVISGRSLGDLARLAGVDDAVHLVGSHGSEFDPGFASSLPPEATRLFAQVRDELAALADGVPGALIEEKPASVALHYRNADERAAEPLVTAALGGPGARAGVFAKHGKKVLELSVVDTNKGRALERLRAAVGATAAIYLGDDRTDEDAFATLRGPDVGVKVGPGETLAAHRVEGPRDVARLLAALAEERARWVAGARAVPIQEHALLSDQRALALVAPEARIVWLCAPRLDAAPLFAELLGGPTAGHFSIRPADGGRSAAQSYAEDSLVLQTRWDAMWVLDYLDLSGDRAQQRAGRSDLVRLLRGRGRALVEFAPRLDFGRLDTRLARRPEGLILEDTLDPIVLRAPGVEWDIVPEGRHQTARALVELGDEPLAFELRYGTGDLQPSRAPEAERRASTLRWWGGWARALALPPLATELVRRSALVLKALCHGPTGAVAAAATTSLPEHPGGVRNWDYRYSWLRDGAMTAEALARLGSAAEAMGFLGWVLDVLDRIDGPERLRPLYTVTGAELGPEAEIGELAGYAGSRPVRVGNAAAQQVQLDVFGPIVSLVHVLLESGAPVTAEHWRLVEAMVRAVERRWQEPDHGIWEVRGPRRHWVHSKATCWLAVDRAIAVARGFLGQERPEWVALREAIADSVLQHGWVPERRSFTAYYGGTALDAGVLQIGLYGLIPVEDERFVATVARVEAELRDGPTVYRYRFEDGLPGREGGFQLCTSWLIESYLALGRTDDARELFERLAASAGPTGLMSEELDPRTGRGLGNHPQAYSHLGLIRCALALSAAAQGAPPARRPSTA